MPWGWGGVSMHWLGTASNRGVLALAGGGGNRKCYIVKNVGVEIARESDDVNQNDICRQWMASFEKHQSRWNLENE